jgi:hypothetical protein
VKFCLLTPRLAIKKCFPTQELQLTNTSQRNHPPNCLVVCVLLVTRDRAVYKCARCDVGLCVVFCLAVYHTKANL